MGGFGVLESGYWVCVSIRVWASIVGMGSELNGMEIK